MEGCNAIKLHAKTEGTEKIKYVDFTSLYLTVNNYDKYPIGHLVMIVQDFENIEFFWCSQSKTLTTNRYMYHPVLPYRANGKLFTLCADTQNESLFQCTDE